MKRRAPHVSLGEAGALFALALVGSMSAVAVAATASAATPAASGASAPPPASSASAARAPAPPLVPAQVATAAVAAGQNVDAGKQIATQGASGAAACVGCHGQHGEGNAQAGFPRIAGMGRSYLEHQLASYADGSRKNQVMQPIASALQPQQRADVAAYYASLGPEATTQKPAPAGTPPVLAVRGDNKRGIQSCANCHGVQGIGDAAANPYLAGQHPQYLANALAAWRDGTRSNDRSGQMQAIAKALTDADTKQLVAYFASLPPPASRNAQSAPMLAAQVNRTAVQSGPVSGTQPSQGQGSEQGAGVTGGSQSHGGTETNPAQAPNAAGTPAAPASR